MLVPRDILALSAAAAAELGRSAAWVTEMHHRIKFTVSAPGADRIHHVSGEDVRVVLSRLPPELWARLRAVHFNDRSRGARLYGYVNRGRREIALCALPPRIGLTRSLRMGQTPQQFGAIPGRKWPALAIRRFMLYDVFLHELGHLQVVVGQARSDRLKFAREKLAQEFAIEWCEWLWSEPFAHPDPVYSAPGVEEITALWQAEESEMPSPPNKALQQTGGA